MADQQPEPLSAELYDEDYFLTACEGYEDFLSSDGENLSRRLEAAFAAASVEPGMKLLDVGCGRGEIVRHCAHLGAHACGIDYAPAAIRLSREVLSRDGAEGVGMLALAQADAKHLPFASGVFDRVLLFDVVEHLYPWELQAALREARRVLKGDGWLIVHTAPNAWYDRYAYPFVRLFRRMTGQGALYPANPRRFLVEHNEDVHVNEQSLFSLRRALRRAGFNSRVWLDSPPQHRRENPVLALLRYLLFHWVPFRWFFEREVFAVASKKR